MTYTAGKVFGPEIEPTLAQVNEELWRVAVDSEAVAERFNEVVLAAYGGTWTAIPTAQTLTATWTIVESMDSLAVPDPRGVSFDLPAHQFWLHWPGTYLLNFTANFEVVETQSSRRFFMRLYNAALGHQVGHQSIIGVGRNQDAGTFSFTMLRQIHEDQANTRLQIETRTDDTFNGFLWYSIDLSITSVGSPLNR